MAGHQVIAAVATDISDELSLTASPILVPEGEEGATKRAGILQTIPTNSAGDELGTEDNPMEISETLNPDAFIEYAHQHTGVATTLAVATTGSGAERDITVVSAVGFAIGDDIQISNGVTEATFPKILNIVGAVFTLDRYIDGVFGVGTDVEKVSFNMAVDGTLAVPQEFIVTPDGIRVAHIQRITIAMTHATGGDLGDFGDHAALANGVLIRVKRGGVYQTLTNWKTNADIKDDMFDVVFDSRASGGGTFGTTGRWTLERFGSEVRLDPSNSDVLEFYIQDSLLLASGGLIRFTAKTQGHYK